MFVAKLITGRLVALMFIAAFPLTAMSGYHHDHSGSSEISVFEIEGETLSLRLETFVRDSANPSQNWVRFFICESDGGCDPLAQGAYYKVGDLQSQRFIELVEATASGVASAAVLLGVVYAGAKLSVYGYVYVNLNYLGYVSTGWLIGDFYKMSTGIYLATSLGGAGSGALWTYLTSRVRSLRGLNPVAQARDFRVLNDRFILLEEEGLSHLECYKDKHILRMVESYEIILSKLEPVN